MTTHLQILDPDHPQRAGLLGTLREVYGAAFDAQPGSLHDRLLSLRDDSGGTLGLIGASCAADHEKLFVEQYLDEPVERIWSRRLGRRVARAEIVEVGNLAARRTGFGPWLVTALAQHLCSQRRPFTVFAATASLRAFFEHLGVTLHDHGAADPARLDHDAACWGRYYESDPRVCSLDARELLPAGEALCRRRPQLAPVLADARSDSSRRSA